MPAVAHTLPSSPSIVPTIGVAELLERLGAVHLRVAHPREHVGAERRLPVDRGLDRGGGAGAQVDQRGDHRGRADVDRDAEHAIGGVARLHVDQAVADTVAVTVDVLLVVDGGGQARQHARGVRHLEPSIDERVGDATQPAARILERGRLRASSRYFTAFGSSSTNRPTPIVAALGTRHRSRHVDHHVLGDLALARQPPALVETLGRRGGSRRASARRGPPAPGPCTCRTCRDRRTSTRSGCPPSARR